MSRGPGERQKFLTELLKQIEGFFLTDICETRTDEQSFTRAIRTAGLPAKKVTGFKSQWIGKGLPPYKHMAEISKGKKSFTAMQERKRAAKENWAKKEEYEERVYQAVYFLSVNTNMVTAGRICRHLETERERWGNFNKSAEEFFKSKAL